MIIKFIISIVKSICLGNLFHQLFYQIKIRFMKNILLQDADYFTIYHPGDLMTRATSDTFSMANVSTHLIFGLITVILTIIMTAISMINLRSTPYSILDFTIAFHLYCCSYNET
ncbi:MAG: ABC transporter transmembrane domain-containing protein [Christensenellales bacterium]